MALSEAGLMSLKCPKSSADAAPVGWRSPGLSLCPWVKAVQGAETVQITVLPVRVVDNRGIGSLLARWAFGITRVGLEIAWLIG